MEHDPFEEWPLEGLEDALAGLEENERNALLKFARELDRARLDARAIYEQPGPVSLMRAVLALEPDRARATLFWATLTLIQLREGANFQAWISAAE